MSATTFTAKFIGKDGSLGYRHGHVYRLQRVPSRWCIAIKRMDGSGFCPYASEEAFDRNWDVLGVSLSAHPDDFGESGI